MRKHKKSAVLKYATWGLSDFWGLKGRGEVILTKSENLTIQLSTERQLFAHSKTGYILIKVDK